MRFRLAHAAALVSSLLLAACSGLAPHQALPGAVKDSLVSTDVVLPIRQNEIYVFVPPSTAGAAGGAAFGVLGAVVGAMVDAGVNNARTSAAEKAVKPLRDSLVGFDYDAALRDDMKASLTQLAWLHATDVKVHKDFGNESYEGAYKTSTASAVLFAGMDYHLSNDGDVLYVTAYTFLFPKNGEKAPVVAKPGSRSRPKLKTAPENAVYRDTLAFQTKVEGATSDRDHNMVLWSADNGAAIRAALKLASVKLSALLASDLERPEKEAAAGGKSVKVEGLKGTIVSTDDDGTLVRFEDGTMKYYTKSIAPK
jgi:hypothetical protein